MLPVEQPRNTNAPASLAARVAELTAENARLAAYLQHQEQRTAQLEPEHREALAARDAAASALGEELGALVADRERAIDRAGRRA